MKRIPLESSTLLSAGYEDPTSTLELEFISGAVYRRIEGPLLHPLHPAREVPVQKGEGLKFFCMSIHSVYVL